MALTGKSPSDTYKDLLEIDNSNSGVDNTARDIKTGNGASTSLKVSDRSCIVTSSTDNTGAFYVQDSGENIKLQVDTTNDQVKALGNHVNSMYTYFNVGNGLTQNFSANTHYLLPYIGDNYPTSLATGLPDIGTGTDPDTTFTTAETNTQRASTLVTCMWYVPDNIAIDAVYSLEGADSGTGDVTRMHLYSYTFTSGSTSALTGGTLLAHNDDVTNAGSEQAYLSTWTVDSSAVTAGKVIGATFRSDSINSDYSVKITIKYHLT